MSDSKAHKSKDMAGKRTRSDRGKGKEAAGRDDPKPHTSRIGWNRTEPARDRVHTRRNSRANSQSEDLVVSGDNSATIDNPHNHLFENPIHLGIKAERDSHAVSNEDVPVNKISRKPVRNASAVNIEDLESCDSLPAEDLSRLQLVQPRRLSKVQVADDNEEEEEESERGSNSERYQGKYGSGSASQPKPASSGQPSTVRRVSESSPSHNDNESETTSPRELAGMPQHKGNADKAGKAVPDHSDSDASSRRSGASKDLGNTASGRVNKSHSRKAGATKNRPSEEQEEKDSTAGAGTSESEDHQAPPVLLLADIVGKGIPVGRSPHQQRETPTPTPDSEEGQHTESSHVAITQVVGVSSKSSKTGSGRDSGKATQASYQVVRGRMEGEGEGERAACSSAESRQSGQGSAKKQGNDVVLDDLEDEDESWSDGEENDAEEEAGAMEADGEHKQAKGAESMENGEHSNHSNGQHSVKGYWGKATGEMSKANRKISSFLKQIRKRGKRRSRETTVKEIHIVPEQEENQWAQRSASSAASRQSASSATSTYSGHSSQDESVPVVNDLEEPDLSRLTH